VGGPELGLQVLVHLEGLAHLFVSEELVWDLERHQELSGVGTALKLWQLAHEPEEEVLDRPLLAVDDVPLEVGVEVRRVAQHLQEANHTFLGLVLSLPLDIYGLMLLVKMSKHLVEQLKLLKWCQVVELNQAKVAHEGRTVQAVNDHLDLGGVQRGGLCEHFGRSGGASEEAAILLELVVVHLNLN